MNLLEKNPFMILGVISNATTKEIHEAETFILRYLDIGKNATLKFDISPPLNELQRDNNSIQNAKNNIHDDCDKLSYAIFWFINGSAVDKIALKKLASEKNIQNALKTFKKGSRDFQISKNSFSSIINFSTLEIASYTDHKDIDRVTNAIKYKYQVIKDKKIFKEFEKIVTSNSNKINQKEYIDIFLENSKDLIREIFPRKNENKLLLDIFSDDKSIIKEIETQMVSKIEKNIYLNIGLFSQFLAKYKGLSDKAIIREKSQIIKECERLMGNTTSDLNKLKKLLGINSFQFKDIVDKIYTLVNAAAVMCFNSEMNNFEVALKSTTSKEKVLKSVNFKVYVKILKDASKKINSIDCDIKSQLNKNLEVIQGHHKQMEEVKSTISYNSRTYKSNFDSNHYSSSSNYNSSSDDGLGSFVGSLFYVILIIIIIAAVGGC